MEKFLPPVITPPEPLDVPSASAWAVIIDAVIKAERIRTGKDVVDASCISDSIAPTERFDVNK